MTKYEASFFRKLFSRIKDMFSKKKIVEEEESKEIGASSKNNNYENFISNFSSESINELVNRYEKGKVKEEELTKEESDQLKKYYTERIQILGKEIGRKKNLIEKKKKNFIELQQKAIKLKKI